MLVKTKDAEFDYPGPDGDVYTQLRRQRRHPGRLVAEPAGLRGAFRHIKFFTISAITGESRVILYDNIMARLADGGALPTFDSNPYMVDRQRPALLDRRRLHDHRPLPVLAARSAASTTSATR